MTAEQKQPERLLALDTSTSTLTAALLEGDQIQGEVQSQSERNHSVNLLPSIQELLRSAGWKPADLDAVAVGQGPGSYTGVRIAVTAAKTLAWTIGKPLIGVSSLEAMAWGAYHRRANSVAGTTWIVPLMDARRGQVYTALFAADEAGGWHQLRADGIRMLDTWVSELHEQISAISGESDGESLQTPPADIDRSTNIARSNTGRASVVPDRIWFVGEIEALLEGLSGKIDHFLTETQTISHGLYAGDVGRLAASRLGGDQVDVHRFVPNYTQLAEAEAKLAAKS